MAKQDTAETGWEVLSRQPIVEKSERWVRVMFNGEFIANSSRTLLLREATGRLSYCFPGEDVEHEHLAASRSGSDGRRYFDVQVGNQVAESGAWLYEEPPPAIAGLKGTFDFQWNKMDRWFEEEEEVYVHPRDPYHRVDFIASSRHVRVAIKGITLAETNRPTIVFETSLPPRFYIPQEDVRMEMLEKTGARTRCPYKGEASYWSLNLDGEIFRNLVWAYEDPISEAGKIKKLLCFFNEKVDLNVDGELLERPVRPWS